MPPAHAPGGKQPPAGPGGKAAALPPPEPALRHRALTAMRRARRSRTARPRGSVAATVIAGVGIGLAGAMLMAFGLFGRQLSDYGRCLSSANTITASQSCYSRFSHALDRAIGLTGRG